MKNRLKEYRHAHNMTIREFAQYLDVHPSQYSRWESNQVQPSCASLRKIAKRLGVKLDDLVAD